MRAIRAGENAVAIWVSGEEPPGRRELTELVRRSLLDGGFAPWEDTEAECFTSGDDLLVIARPGQRRRAVFFSSLEDLLFCAGAIPAEGGALYAARGGYIWVVTAAESSAGMCEFGEELRLHPLWESHAAEQGRRILPEGAGRVLRETFRQE